MKIYPMVARKDGKMRIGKGFSKSELKEAEVDFKHALRLTIPVDLRRKTRHEENVNVLKQQLGLRMPKTSKPREPSKKLSKKPSEPMKSKVAEKKPTKQKKTTEISKASEHVKAQRAKKTTRRKATKSKSIEKT